MGNNLLYRKTIGQVAKDQKRQEFNQNIINVSVSGGLASATAHAARTDNPHTVTRAQIRAQAQIAPVTKSSTYTASVSDFTILCDTSGGGFDIDLLTAVGNAGLMYHIKKISTDTNSATIDPNGSEQIEGMTSLILEVEGDAAAIVSDNVGWRVI